MKSTYFYKIILKTGIEMTVSRMEEERKHLPGLWYWSKKQVNPVLIDFNECTIDASDIAVIFSKMTAEDIQYAVNPLTWTGGNRPDEY